jgi:hypothetical protein
MSLILDALNRSDSERANPDAAPGLHTVHGAPTGQDVPLWRKAIWPVLVIVLGILAVLPWLGERDPAPAQADRQAAPGPAAAESTIADDPPVPGPTVALPAVKEPPAAVAAEKAARPAEVSGEVAALYESRPAEAIEPSAPAPSRRASGTAPTKPAADAGAGEAPPVNIDSLARAAEAGLVDRRALTAKPVVEHEAPFIAELSQPVKDQIPSIFYSAHKWATVPSQRSVVLNGQERRAGQQVKPGLKLVEILEDSIVLDFQGTEFRLRSLNSWVNL